MNSDKNKLTGIVRTVYGTVYSILPLPSLKGELIGKLRGKLRLENKKSNHHKLRHLIIVGDMVNYQSARGSDEVIIESLIPRKNAIYRCSANQTQALGANLDNALLTTSLTMPEPNFRFVDRFLASCYAEKINPILLFSKIDLLEKQSDTKQKLMMVETYRDLDYPVFIINLLSEKNEKEFNYLKNIVSEGTTLIAGRSGTGKSTLLNRLMGRTIQKTASVSRATYKGRHTTTNSMLITDLHKKAMFIDSPGLKEWGVVHLDRTQIIESFPELHAHAKNCPFKECRHMPDDLKCRVQQFIREYKKSQTIVEKESIDNSEKTLHPERLKSLQAMLDSLLYSERIRTGDYIKPTGRLRD